MDHTIDRALSEVKRLGLRLKLGDAVKEGAADLLVRYSSEASIPEGKTSLIVASSLYMSSVMWGRPISQTKAAEAVGVAPSTLRRYYKRMAKTLFPNAGECCKRQDRMVTT